MILELWPLLVLVLIALLLWRRGAASAALFVIQVRDGRATRAQGTVTAAFLSAVSDVCRTAAVSAGEIRGVPRGGRIALEFSADFPAEVRQQINNLWAEQGWSARPRRRHH